MLVGCVPVERKYETELMVLALAYGYILVRPQDLDTVNVERADETYIYLIGSMPRVTLDPASAMSFDGEIRVNGRLSVRGGAEEFQAVIKHAYGEGVFIDCPYPHDEYSIRRFGERPMLTGVVANMRTPRSGVSGLPVNSRNFKVLYVGQAFGKGGERSSIHRLKSHSTLQNILAEATPDVQIWLVLCRLDDLTLTGAMGAIGSAKIQGDSDFRHHHDALKWLNSQGSDRREAVSLAEACLIRYFRPRYNSQLKETFPQPQHAVLKSLDELDLNSVAVELQLQDLAISAGNETVKAGNWHAAPYEIHFDSDREPILDSAWMPSTTDEGNHV